MEKQNLLHVLADATLISFLHYAPFHSNASELRDISTDTPPTRQYSRHACKIKQMSKFSPSLFSSMLLVFKLHEIM
jgi:hypothetical protein